MHRRRTNHPTLSPAIRDSFRIVELIDAGGSIERILEMKCDLNCPWTDTISVAAAYRGDMEVFKVIHENGCPFSLFTAQVAAERDHFEVLIWALKNGCPYKKSVLVETLNKNYEDKIKTIVSETGTLSTDAALEAHYQTFAEKLRRLLNAIAD